MRSHRRFLLSVLSLVIVPLGLAGCGDLKAVVRSDIDRQIRERQPAFAECYKAALERDKTVRGTVMLGFQVPASARQVGQVQLVSSSINDPAFKQCVVAKAQGLTLVEAHSRPLDVSYPLSFDPL